MTITSTQVSNYSFGDDYNYENDRRSLDVDLKSLFLGLQKFQKYIKYGNGSPEGVVTAQIGSIYLRFDSTGTNSIYLKQSGTGNTGWQTIGTAPGPGSPGGSSGDIQYNNSGVFGGFGDWDGSTLTVGGAIDVGSGNAFYLGNPTTNGTWRIVRSGNNLAFERRESGSWVEKTAITP